MDYSTVITSALLSVVLSVFVAARIAMRQEQGKARQQAQDALREAVRQRWREARRVELRMTPPARLPGRYDSGDLVFTSRILQIAEALPWWRRALVRRRLRILVGRMWVDQLEVQPADDSSLGSIMAPILSAQFREQERPQYEDRDRAGLYWTALNEGQGVRAARSLRRHLGLLARGW